MLTTKVHKGGISLSDATLIDLESKKYSLYLYPLPSASRLSIIMHTEESKP